MGNAPGLCPSLLGAPSNTAEMQQQFHTHSSPARLHQVIPSNSALPNHALSSGSALELLLEERNPSRGSAKLLGSEQLWDVVGKLELHRVTKGRLRASHCSSQFPEAVRAYRTGTARLRRMQGKETATICKQNSDWIEWKKFFTVKTIKPWNWIPERFGISMPENSQSSVKKDLEHFSATKNLNKNTYIGSEHSKTFFADNQKAWRPLQ